MKIIELKDFYLCGLLLLEGFHLVDNTRENGYTVFSFEDTPVLKQEISKYYRSQCTVDPASYGMMLRQLKGVMHNSISTQNHENNNNVNNNGRSSN